MTRLLAALFFWTCAAHAQLAIEITGAGAQRIPVAIVPFAGENALPPGISSIVRADLERSGFFRGLELPPIVPEPTEATNINYAEWRSRLADALLVGSLQPRQDGRFEARFRLYDVVKQVPLGGVRLHARQGPVARHRPHRISDFVYEKLTGEKGVFSTRIAYVVKRGNRFELQISDYDGAGAETALASFEPIISRSGRPTASGWRTCRSRTRSRWSTCTRSSTASAASSPTSRARTRPRPDARWQQAGGGAFARGWLPALHDQRRWQRGAAPRHLDRHRYRAALLPRRPVDLLHLRPRCTPPDLPHAGERRRAAAHHLRGQL